MPCVQVLSCTQLRSQLPMGHQLHCCLALPSLHAWWIPCCRQWTEMIAARSMPAFKQRCLRLQILTKPHVAMTTAFSAAIECPRMCQPCSCLCVCHTALQQAPDSNSREPLHARHLPVDKPAWQGLATLPKPELTPCYNLTPGIAPHLMLKS
jgi:hypothetical protein